MALTNFEKELDQRDLEMEFRLLTRMNCHKLHFQSLFKSQNIDFKNKNRYQEVLPFQHSMVRLVEIKETSERYGFYVNANYINVRAAIKSNNLRVDQCS